MTENEAKSLIIAKFSKNELYSFYQLMLENSVYKEDLSLYESMNGNLVILVETTLMPVDEYFTYKDIKEFLTKEYITIMEDKIKLL